MLRPLLRFAIDFNWFGELLHGGALFLAVKILLIPGALAWAAFSRLRERRAGTSGPPLPQGPAEGPVATHGVAAPQSPVHGPVVPPPAASGPPFAVPPPVADPPPFPVPAPAPAQVAPAPVDPPR